VARLLTFVHETLTAVFLVLVFLILLHSNTDLDLPIPSFFYHNNSAIIITSSQHSAATVTGDSKRVTVLTAQPRVVMTGALSSFVPFGKDGTTGAVGKGSVLVGGGKHKLVSFSFQFRRRGIYLEVVKIGR